MEKRFSQFTVPKWFKWTITALLAVLLILAGFFMYMYNDILNSKEAGFEQSKTLALQETELAVAEEITRFHGSSLYHAVAGRTENGQQALAFIPVDNDEAEIAFFSEGEILSVQEVLNEWRSNCQNCQLQKFNYALSSGKALLEIAYINEKDRYVFDYFSLKDGTRYETLQLKRS